MELFKKLKEEEKTNLENKKFEEHVSGCIDEVSNILENHTKLLEIALGKISLLELQVQTLEMKTRKDSEVH